MLSQHKSNEEAPLYNLHLNSGFFGTFNQEIAQARHDYTFLLDLNKIRLQDKI